MKDKTLKKIFFSAAFLLAILFLLKFSLAPALRTYIEIGIGNCRKIPIFCMAPEGKITTGQVDRNYLTRLLPYAFPKVSLSMPKGFSVVQEKVKKPYYKRNKRKGSGSIAYVLYEEPGFFVTLFPQLTRTGIKDNYAFLKRTMHARINQIENIQDAFFVIMKGIFIPDIGEQSAAKMQQFLVEDKKVFINYNLTKEGNYFDCNVIDSEGGFFKLYIKDKNASLGLNEVLTVISTLKKTTLPPDAAKLLDAEQ